MNDYYCESEDYCYAKKRVKMTHKWYDVREKKPEEKRAIIGIDSGGTEHNLKFYKNLFWLPDMSMYVYFTPNKWRYI